MYDAHHTDIETQIYINTYIQQQQTEKCAHIHRNKRKEGKIERDRGLRQGFEIGVWGWGQRIVAWTCIFQFLKLILQCLSQHLHFLTAELIIMHPNHVTLIYSTLPTFLFFYFFSLSYFFVLYCSCLQIDIHYFKYFLQDSYVNQVGL